MFACLYVHPFLLDVSIAPLQVHYYSEAFLTTARIQCQSYIWIAYMVYLPISELANESPLQSRLRIRAPTT